MKRTEQRPVVVTYCDVCGEEIVGAITVFNEGTANEKHACNGWIEAEGTRCDLKMNRQLLQDEGDAKTQN